MRKQTLVLLYGLCATMVFWATDVARSQSKSSPRSSVQNTEEFLRLVDFLNAQSCIQDIPAPTLMFEPRFTQGLTNTICFRLPSGETVPFSADTVRNPYVITTVDNGRGEPALRFPRPVDLEDESIQLEIVTGLKSGIRYSYSTALFLPVCTVDCEAITDSTQLEVHCSAYQDTVWSLQDNMAPVIQGLHVPELSTSPVAGWTNQSAISVQADVVDQAGVWQAFLYRRTGAESEWVNSVADTTFPSTTSEFGFVFNEQAGVIFAQNLPDGFYEFRIEGKDATHTPESCFPNFELAGNGGTPLNDSEPHLRINIDTAPPTSVELSCEQVLNTIRLNWSASTDPAPGVGLQGYRVYRDGTLMGSVSGSTTTYVDTFPPSTPTTEFSYQIQPFDSLSNVQTEGGSSVFEFQVVSQVLMLAEPNYTSGLSNQVCWTSSPNIESYTLFIAKDCDYSAATQVSVTDTCFTFNDLEDGANYCYWVRAVDEQQRVVLSDTVQSRQDATAPVVNGLSIVGTQSLSSGDWTTKREIRIELQAADSEPGLIQSYEILENGQLAASADLTELSGDLTLTLPHTIQSDECSEVQLTAQVMDAAGNQSTLALTAFHLDETPPEPVSSLTSTQLFRVNGVRLDWSVATDPGECSGLAGYRIFRDDNQIATVGAEAVRFDDFLAEDTPSKQFLYEVFPVDSLGNVQTLGPTTSMDYVGVSRITIEPLPSFTAGLSNEICVQISGSLETFTLFLDEDCDSIADDSVSVSSPQLQYCHVFANLLGGQEYCYWATGRDLQQRGVQSNQVSSIQDNSAPVIDLFSLPQADSLNGQLWVYGKTVQLHLVAHDAAPGEIWNYEVLENGQPRGIIGLPDSSTQLNMVVPYVLSTPVGQLAKIELAVRVLDGANNVSELQTISFNAQESLPTMFAFPNPFNPMKGGLTIRLEDVTETEIRVFDFFGNLVRTLTQKANSRDFIWDGRNGKGEMVASGGYVCVGTHSRARFKIGIMKQAF